MKKNTFLIFSILVLIPSFIQAQEITPDFPVMPLADNGEILSAEEPVKLPNPNIKIRIKDKLKYAYS